MNDLDQIKEQIEILRRHCDGETFDAAFVQTHGRYIANLAKQADVPLSAGYKRLRRLIWG